jgi:hypothetical protein
VTPRYGCIFFKRYKRCRFNRYVDSSHIFEKGAKDTKDADSTDTLIPLIQAMLVATK